MHAYTLNYSFVDNGDSQCEQRKRFEEYLRSFWEKGSQIATNIYNYETLINKKADNLFKVSANFFTSAIINAFSLSTIWLSAFFSDSDTASIIKFLNYCEQNQKYIFTKDFYEEKVNVPNSKIKVEMSSFTVELQESRQLLLDNIDLIKELKDNRDKIFAHFEKDFLITHKKQLTISIENLKKLLELAEEIVNKIGSFYDRTFRSFSPIDISDIQQTISVVDGFVKNKKTIIELKKTGVLI